MKRRKRWALHHYKSLDIFYSEALGSLVLAITTAIIGLIGSTAMAGAVGGGGIGDLALVYGYQRFDTTVIIITVIVLVIIVQVIQTLGNVLARFIRRH